MNHDDLRTIQRHILLTALLAAGVTVLRAQDRFREIRDSNFVSPNGGFYHTMFTAGTAYAPGRQPRLQANSSAYLGAALDYDWLFVGFDINLPRTSVLRGSDKQVKAAQIVASHWWNRWGLEGSFQQYKGLVDQEFPGPRPQYANTIWQWVNYRYAGINVDYFFSPSRFSFKAAYNYSKLQVRSGGSFLFMITPYYQTFSLQKSSLDTSVKDTILYDLITKNANHIVLLGKVGYAYNFSWDNGHWTCAPLFCIGPGVGVYLDDLHAHQKFFPNLGYQGRLAAGYNGNTWYAYVSGLYDLAQEPAKYLGLKTINESASLTLGYRFRSLSHRILGIL